MKVVYTFIHGILALIFVWQCDCSSEDAGLYFVKEPSTVVASEGWSTSFSCKARTNFGTKIKYTWMLNQSYINEDDALGFRFSSDAGGSLLVIDAVNRSRNSGSYQCLAICADYGSIVSVPAMLQVAYFRIDPRRTGFLRVTEFLPCLIKLPEYDSMPAPTFKWQLKNSANEYVDVADNPLFFVTSRGDLMISSVKREHVNSFRAFIYHQALKNENKAYLFILRGEQNGDICANDTITSFPTVKKRTVTVGDNVSFDCLAVAKNCSYPLSILWTKGDATHISSKRSLALSNVDRRQEGTFVCTALVKRTNQKERTVYTLKIIEKPVVLVDTSSNVIVGPDGLLKPAVFDGIASFSWRKDGHIISNNSELFQVYPNRTLRILHKSLAFAGLYQFFGKNGAGFTVVTQLIKFSKASCGWRLSGQRGSIRLYNPDTSSLEQNVTCAWLLETLSTDLIRFNMVKFNFSLAASDKSDVTLRLYRGSTDSTTPSFTCDTAMAARSLPSFFERGPHILILLQSNKKFLESADFLLEYHTTSPTVAASASTVAHSTAIITSQEPTRHGTTTTGSSHIATTRIRAVEQKKGLLPIGALIGIVIGVLVVLILVSLICYRKRLWKKLVSKRPIDAVQTKSLPRFNIYQSGNAGARNRGFQGDNKAVSSSGMVPTLQYDCSHFTESDRDQYDTVGGIIRTGSEAEVHDVYDVVGGTIEGSNGRFPLHASTAVSNISNFSKSSSTKSEPFYHQLEKGINVTYESADMLKVSQGASLTQTNAAVLARVPSGRSDAQYTSLEEDAVWASKENSIYESLAVDHSTGSCSRADPTLLGEYCEPCNDDSNDLSHNVVGFKGFKGQKRVLYDSGSHFIESDANLGEYSEPYEQRQRDDFGDQLYSEPL